MPDEYISREAAIEEIDKWLDSVGTALVGKGLSYYGELIGCIEDARAANVAEVVHGRWIWNEEGEIDWDQFYRCSNCGDKEYWESNFCPNCGAKMDLEDNDG